MGENNKGRKRGRDEEEEKERRSRALIEVVKNSSSE